MCHLLLQSETKLSLYVNKVGSPKVNVIWKSFFPNYRTQEALGQCTHYSCLIEKEFTIFTSGHK